MFIDTSTDYPFYHVDYVFADHVGEDASDDYVHDAKLGDIINEVCGDLRNGYVHDSRNQKAIGAIIELYYEGIDEDGEIKTKTAAYVNLHEDGSCYIEKVGFFNTVSFMSEDELQALCNLINCAYNDMQYDTYDELLDAYTVNIKERNWLEDLCTDLRSFDWCEIC